MILQSISASFDLSQPFPHQLQCPCGNFSNPRKTQNIFSLPTSKRRRKQLLIANFPRKSIRRKWGISACAISPDGPGPSMNIELAKSTRRGAKHLVLKRCSSELDKLDADEFSEESQIQMGSNFTNFQEDPFVDKLRTQLGVIHPIPAPPINRNIVGLFVFFFFVGVAFDKLWTSRKRSKLGSESGRREAWPQVPTSFSLFLEKDLQRKESVEWVNMVLGKLWKVYRAGLENWLIGLLQPVIDNLKKPDYVQRVEIKQFSLGDEPLSVRNVERRTSRRVNDLQYQIGLRYTGGARMLLMLSLKFSIIPIYVPVGVRDFDIDGELWVKLRLIPTEPWVGAVSWAFVSLPKIKFNLSPFRLFNLMAIPVLSMFLTKLLTEDLPRLFVRPKKIVLDFQKIKAVGPVGDDFKSEDKQEGNIQEGNKDFVGELSVTLVDARKLSYVFYGKTDPFVTLSLGDQIIRSKKNSQTTVIGPPGEPIWNQDFQFLVANPKKQKLCIQVKDSLGFTDLTIGTGEVDLGSLQDTVPTDRIVALQGGWGLFKKGSSGEILLRLTYKAYVEDEEDDRAEVDSFDTDPSDSDDELSDSDESNAYEKDKIESANETDNESFMDVLAALIVSEEFQGIVASETGNTKLFDDVSSAGSKISRSRGLDAESVPSNSNNDSEVSREEKTSSLSKMTDLQTPLRPKRKTALVDFLVQFRWIVVIFVVLPISFTMYFLTYLGDVRSAMKSYKQRQKEHEENVKKVVKRLKQRNPSKDGLVCTARKPWIAVGMRNVDYKRARHFEVDLSAFRNVLEIDQERMIARVEPLVNMGQITRVTCPMNLALAVVAEFDDLTVGGLINGYGIEGSSHIYGLFSDTVVAYEIVLADGRVVRATRDNEFSDLFYAIPWSQGTLGFLVSAEIKLIPIKEYMRLTYKPVVGNLQELAQAYIDSFAPRDGDQDNPEKVPDFVETMIYTPTEAVCMTGRYASKEEAKKKGNVINSVGWWFKPWFYQHAQKALKKGEFVEYIPTREYYHRHTRSIYWEGKLILPFADQWWFRFLLGWMMPPKVSLLKATQGEAIRNYYHDNHVIQDMLVPLYKVGDALEWVHHEMEVYPIWLCPHRLYKSPVKTMIYTEPGFEHQRRQGDTHYSQMYTDVGVYYAPGPVLRGEAFDGAEAVRRMENWLIENHGFQPQYAVSELTEQKFWKMFDAGHYEYCRRKYGAVGTFMSVYYKSKKGRKTEKEVQEAEQAILETPIAEVDEPVDY